MPSFKGFRSASQAPKPRKTSRKSLTRQKVYEDLINELPEGQVGELEPDSGETTRSVKVNLGTAAKRLGVQVMVWDAHGYVYFTRGTKGRPPSAAEVNRASASAQLPIDEDKEITLS